MSIEMRVIGVQTQRAVGHYEAECILGGTSFGTQIYSEVVERPFFTIVRFIEVHDEVDTLDIPF